MASEIKANKISPATGTAFTIGDSGDTFTLPSGATLAVASGATISNAGTASGFFDGLKELDKWYVNGTISIGGASVLLTSLARSTLNGFTKKGTGMSESSGVFSFPSTGYWQVVFQAYFWGDSVASASYVGGVIEATVDNGSNWATESVLYNDIYSTVAYAATTTGTIFNVTDIANDKLRFRVNSSGNVKINGSQAASTIQFMKLSD